MKKGFFGATILLLGVSCGTICYKLLGSRMVLDDPGGRARRLRIARIV